MSPNLQSSFSRFITGRNPWLQNEFCEDCHKDMAGYKSLKVDASLRFRGPYIIRTEAHYQVISLPGFVYVFIGPPEKLDWDKVEKDRALTIKKLKRPKQIIGFMELFPVSRSVGEQYLDEVEADPYPFVRDLSKNLRSAIKESR